MMPLNHKRTTSSLVPPIFYVAKKFFNKKIEGTQLKKLKLIFLTLPVPATNCTNEEAILQTNKQTKIDKWLKLSSHKFYTSLLNETFGFGSFYLSLPQT